MPDLRRRTLDRRAIFVSTVLGLVSIAFAHHRADAMQVEANAHQSVSTAPLTLTLQDAIAHARKNDPGYRAALTEYGLAKQDRVQGRAALLPSANYSAEFLYTQGNGTPTGRFVGANGVHEYVSQGNVHQDISLQGIADYGRHARG
jgi:outer membrane protein TolC